MIKDDYTILIIELLSLYPKNNNKNNEDTAGILELIIADTTQLDSHHIHLILSLLDYDDGYRYEIFNIINEKINALTIDDLVNIIKCFQKEEYKYEIIVKLIKKCLPSNDYTEVMLQFENETLWIDINNIIKNVSGELVLDELLSSLKSFNCNERLELLEKSISGTGIKLNNSEQYCEHIKEIFDCKYEDGCQILGINPDVYKEWM